MPGTKKTVPAQPAKGKLVCKAVKDSDVHDGWCDTNCASDPPNCPTKKCKCEGGNPTASGMPAHMTPEEYQAWKENDEKKKAAADRAKHDALEDVAAEQEARKQEIRDEAAAQRAAEAEAAAKAAAEKEQERERVEAERESAAQEIKQESGQRGTDPLPSPEGAPEQPVAPEPAGPRPMTPEEEEAQKQFEKRERDREEAQK